MQGEATMTGHPTCSARGVDTRALAVPNHAFPPRTGLRQKKTPLQIIEKRPVYIVMFFFDDSDFMIFGVIRVKSLLLVSADTASLHSRVFSTDMNVSSISNDVSIRFFGKR